MFSKKGRSLIPNVKSITGISWKKVWFVMPLPHLDWKSLLVKGLIFCCTLAVLFALIITIKPFIIHKSCDEPKENNLRAIKDDDNTNLPNDVNTANSSVEMGRSEAINSIPDNLQPDDENASDVTQGHSESDSKTDSAPAKTDDAVISSIEMGTSEATNSKSYQNLRPDTVLQVPVESESAVISSLGHNENDSISIPTKTEDVVNSAIEMETSEAINPKPYDNLLPITTLQAPVKSASEIISTVDNNEVDSKTDSVLTKIDTISKLNSTIPTLNETSEVDLSKTNSAPKDILASDTLINSEKNEFKTNAIHKPENISQTDALPGLARGAVEIGSIKASKRGNSKPGESDSEADMISEFEGGSSIISTSNLNKSNINVDKNSEKDDTNKPIPKLISGEVTSQNEVSPTPSGASCTEDKIISKAEIAPGATSSHIIETSKSVNFTTNDSSGPPIIDSSHKTSTENITISKTEDISIPRKINVSCKRNEASATCEPVDVSKIGDKVTFPETSSLKEALLRGDNSSESFVPLKEENKVAPDTTSPLHRASKSINSAPEGTNFRSKTQAKAGLKNTEIPTEVNEPITISEIILPSKNGDFISNDITPQIIAPQPISPDTTKWTESKNEQASLPVVMNGLNSLKKEDATDEFKQKIANRSPDKNFGNGIYPNFFKTNEECFCGLYREECFCPSDINFCNFCTYEDDFESTAFERFLSSMSGVFEKFPWIDEIQDFGGRIKLNAEKLFHRVTPW